MVEDAKVDSKTSFITSCIKNSSISIDLVEYAEVGDIIDNSDNETIERSPLFKM